MAGDEFVVLCEQVEMPSTLAALAERINDALRRPVELADMSLFVSASIGVAIGHGSTHNADDLLRAADTAMYEVKKKGRDGWQFFSDTLQDQARQRLAIIQGLRQVVERDELSLRFQPIVAADSGRIVGAEALLRWHPPAGEISPAVFIPVSETTGAIVQIGAWVFRAGCLVQAGWQRRWGDAAPYLSINISARQLGEADVVDRFAEILRETGADPAKLLLEVTETALMADIEANLRALHRLAELGLRMAVDDFGTGYSSLAQLTRLPVDVLKIDRAFVDGIETRAESRAVIHAVIGLGRALGLKLIAEGVETHRQLQELIANGCDMIQGYYFYRPMLEADFIDAMEINSGAEIAASEPPIHFLIYVSRTTRALAADEVEALRDEAARFNAANGITGHLIYQDGCFMQMLEGEQASVEALMARIRRDPRHTDIRVVIEGKAWRRAFPSWGLGVRDFSHGADLPDFNASRGRTISFIELAEDSRLCYLFITGLAPRGK
jgi:predicted signal transduction protein with EAL and GGDEF domain